MAKRGRPPKNPLRATGDVNAVEPDSNSGDASNPANPDSTDLPTGPPEQLVVPTPEKPAKKKLSKAQKGAIQKMLAARQKSIKAEKKAANAKVKPKKRSRQTRRKSEKAWDANSCNSRKHNINKSKKCTSN